MNIIEASNIFKTFNNGFQAVKGIDFSVETGTCFGILGPNGAGKTTLMKVIYGRLNRDSLPRNSSLTVFGTDPLNDPRIIKSNTGIVPQDSNLDADLTVIENLLVYSKFFNMSAKEANTRIEELLLFFELNEKKLNRASELSGGMIRRLLIARAMIQSPKLIIMDEPTVGLDPQVRQLIWKKIRQLKENGITILLTTHYMDEAYQICDTIIIMDKGKKILEGNPKKLMKEHMEKYVIEVEYLHENISLNKIDPIRIEREENAARCFSNNFNDLKSISLTLQEEQYLIRPTNLEDLFIKLTGSKLNEYQ